MNPVNNSTSSPVISKINTPRAIPTACSTINGYIDCLQEGNPLAIAALTQGAIIVGLLIYIARKSTCCSERHSYCPIIQERFMERVGSEIELEIELEASIELEESEPEIPHNIKSPYSEIVRHLKDQYIETDRG